MGMDVRVTGAITITPVVLMPEIRAHPEFTDKGRDVRIEVKSRREDTPEGYLQRFVSTAIVAATEPGYNLAEHTQFIVDALPGREFGGYLECRDGEGDLWRLVVRDGKVTEVYPEIVWPDDGPPTETPTREVRLTEVWRA